MAHPEDGLSPQQKLQDVDNDLPQQMLQDLYTDLSLLSPSPNKCWWPPVPAILIFVLYELRISVLIFKKKKAKYLIIWQNSWQDFSHESY